MCEEKPFCFKVKLVGFAAVKSKKIKISAVQECTLEKSLQFGTERTQKRSIRTLLYLMCKKASCVLQVIRRLEPQNHCYDWKASIITENCVRKTITTLLFVKKDEIARNVAKGYIC